MNLGSSRIDGIAQAEMKAPVIRGNVTATGQNILAHTHAVRLQIDCGAGCIAGAFRAARQLQFNPVMVVGIHVPQQYRRAVDGIDNHIDLAVIKQVAKSRSASGNHHSQTGIFCGRNVLEAPCFSCFVGHIVKEEGSLSEGGPVDSFEQGGGTYGADQITSVAPMSKRPIT